MSFNHDPTGMSEMNTCDHCGGTHDDVPVTSAQYVDGELGAYCPHCGEWMDFDENDPDEIDTHPSVPDSEPVTRICRECNGGYKVDV